MIDKIIGYDENFKCSLYMSDIAPYANYIGYEDENGAIIIAE